MGRIPRLSEAFLFLILGALLPGPAPVSAQEDFRSLDPGRPLRTTDAYPKKLFEWELQVGARGEIGEESRSGAAPLALGVGLLPNLEAGLEVEPGFEDPDDADTAWGVEEVGLHVLYNFNQESWRWPAFAAQLGVVAPVGGGEIGREGWETSGRLVATRSFASRVRVHANGGYRHRNEADGGEFWIGGLAVDVPLGLSSRLLMADVFAEIPKEGGPTRSWAGVGARFQVSNWTVLDLGVATRTDRWADGPSNVELTVGLSRVFGIRALTPAPRYPEPPIR
ncbi:MAG: hypothetical protein ACOC5J_00640 [Gemmatimonadota bacterium]